MLEMSLSLDQTKNKLIPTWRQEEKESNPEWIQKETVQDTTWIQRKMVRKMSPQRGDEGNRKIKAQVVRRHNPQIRHGMT